MVVTLAHSVAKYKYIVLELSMEDYKPRLVGHILKEKLQSTGTVLIEGPKWCGKTTTAEHIAKSVLYMSEPKNKKRNLMFADSDPSMLLIGETPRLIDEWQIAPPLWDAVRFEVDHRKKSVSLY